MGIFDLFIFKLYINFVVTEDRVEFGRGDSDLIWSVNLTAKRVMELTFCLFVRVRHGATA